ncbi:expressed unknown protein [Seminavis robusta]|uniref:Uncharacterized protein n=1 Tax=Seminavis robusta TaxID=568900 RepID=A0A9N8HGB8_9STRA|nr:expressed unknown protein [Seminavis robusta]|eukprot:Sro476_g150590.1 n/a (997) ;mRNA; r:43909-47004
MPKSKSKSPNRRRGAKSSVRNSDATEVASNAPSRTTARSSSNDTTSSTGRRLVIRPLASVGDSGKPSTSVSKDLRRVSNFIEDERHLVAYELYRNVKPRWEALIHEKRGYDAAATEKANEKKGRAWMKKGANEEEKFDLKEFEAANAIFQKHKEKFALLMKRAPLLLECRDNMDQSEGWTLAQTLFGVTTCYRREDDGSLSIKLDGELKGVPLFEQVAVLREVDLHSFWAPFVSSSQTLAHLDKLDTVGWFQVGLPNFGVARDSVFRAMGCDCVAEDESVLLVGRGVEDRPPGVDVPDSRAKFMVEDPVLKTLDIPPWPTRMGAGRMTMKRFEAKIKVMGPDHCHTYLIANLDPNLAFIPTSLLEYVMKKLCGFLLNKLQGAAKKIPKDPVRNVHAQRMRDEAAFYRDWLYPKFNAIAAEKGWVMSPISAFELTESQQMEVNKLNARRTTKMHSFSEFDPGNSSKEKVKIDSTRSEPGTYRPRSKQTKRSNSSGDEDDDSDNSDISSLSGTSQSIWSRNPISSYLRDVEARTQERKDKAKQDSQRKALARLRPRPISVDKQERLLELKKCKQRKLQNRWSSMDSMDTLPPVEETDGDTVVTGRSVPYSPMTASMKGHGRWPRFLLVSMAILFLSTMLHASKFLLPSFGSHGFVSVMLRELFAVSYLGLCGVAHFAICDMLLIYAFEAFELGMKSGEQVKTFYRGQVRFGTAAVSGMLVVSSVSKAVVLATIKSAITAVANTYNHHMSGSDAEEELIDGVADSVKEPATNLAMQINETLGSMLPGSFILGYSALASFLGDSHVTVASFLVHSYATVMSFLVHSYTTVMSISHSVFDWQMAVFVRSNFLGRSLERVITGTYDWWIGLLTGVANGMLSFASCDDPSSEAFSWREDATATLRPLLLYTVVFLWVVLGLVNILAQSYRHRKLDPDAAASLAATSTNSDNSGSFVPNMNGDRTKSSSAPLDSASKRSNSSSRRRLRFNRKKKEALEDDDSMM